MYVLPPFIFPGIGIIFKVAPPFSLWSLLFWVQIFLFITSLTCIPQLAGWIADCELIFALDSLAAGLQSGVTQESPFAEYLLIAYRTSEYCTLRETSQYFTSTALSGLLLEYFTWEQYVMLLRILGILGLGQVIYCH